MRYYIGNKTELALREMNMIFYDSCEPILPRGLCHRDDFDEVSEHLKYIDAYKIDGDLRVFFYCTWVFF